jgi:hypothetical protein
MPTFRQRHRAILAMLATTTATPPAALAAGLVSLHEPFNYDPAAITQLTDQAAPYPNHPWNQAGPGGGDASTGLPHPVAGNLPMPGGMVAARGNMALFGGAGEGTRINVSSDNQTITTDGTTLYYSLALRVASVDHLTATGQILTCFTQYLNGGTGSQSSLGAVLWVKPGSDTGHYKLGLSSRGASAEVVWDESHDYVNGSTQFVVADDTLTTAGQNADDMSRIWFNPIQLGGAEPPANIITKLKDFNSSATVGDMNFFGSFEIRRPPATQTINITDVNSIAIDELRLGTSFAEVTPVVTFLPGDANGDGVVDSTDFGILATNFNTAGTTVQTGDFNADGKTNSLDFNVLATNYGRTSSAPALGVALAPEPSALAFLLFAAPLTRRRIF